MATVTLANVIALLYKAPLARAHWYSIIQKVPGSGMGPHLSRALGVVIKGQPYIISYKGTVHGHGRPNCAQDLGIRAQISTALRALPAYGVTSHTTYGCHMAVAYTKHPTVTAALQHLLAGGRVSARYGQGLTKVMLAFNKVQPWC